MIILRTKVLEIIIAILLGLLIPSLLVLMLQDRQIKDSPVSEPRSTEQADKQTNDISLLTDGGKIMHIPLEEYVISVVLSEMPADFEPEALKAQAVVARTYALRRTVKSGKHNDATVCTKSSCCQGYISPEAYRNKGGKQANIDKISNAVYATAGLVLVYDGKLIDATYFSCSGGSTEDAQSVWGTEVPYLKSVKSPGEEGATHYVDSKQFSAAEFSSKLGLSETQTIKIGTPEYTAGGGISYLDINGQRFTGTQLRKLLKLRSTAFYITLVGKTVTITTKGHGHRVGMSQYGADAMAISGATYDQILQHYYSGVELIPFVFD